MVATVVVPLFWEKGTLIATAVTPIIVAVVSELLHEPVERIGAVGMRRPTAEQTGRGLLAGVSKVVTAVLLQSAAAGALSTLRALDDRTPSGPFVGSARFGQLRGRPELLDVYASAKNPATAARL